MAVDSFDMLPVMLGIQDPEKSVRPYMLTQSFRSEFQLRQGDWKYLDHVGSGGNGYEKGDLASYALPELAPEASGQLYNLARDPGEGQKVFLISPSRYGKSSLVRDVLRGLGQPLQQTAEATA